MLGCQVCSALEKQSVPRSKVFFGAKCASAMSRTRCRCSDILIIGMSGQDWKIPIWRWSPPYWRRIVQFFKFCWSSQQLVWKFVKRGAGGLTIIWHTSRSFCKLLLYKLLFSLLLLPHKENMSYSDFYNILSFLRKIFHLHSIRTSLLIREVRVWVCFKKFPSGAPE